MRIEYYIACGGSFSFLLVQIKIKISVSSSFSRLKFCSSVFCHLNKIWLEIAHKTAILGV